VSGEKRKKTNAGSLWVWILIQKEEKKPADAKEKNRT
jgi:hypothetical protein